MKKKSSHKHVPDVMWDHLGRLRWELGKTVKEIAKDHKHICSQSTIYRIVEEWYLLGGVRNPKRKSGGDRRSSMELAHLNLLFTQCHQTPWWFLDEYQKFLLIKTGVNYSLSCLSRVFIKNGYTSKKLERMSTKRSAILRAHYVSSMKGFDPECMIFIDESHVDDRSSRRRMGRALKGKKAKVYEFLGRGNSHSILAAMNIDGFVLKACRTLDFTVNESVFMTWARECLAPVLGAYPNNRNSIVILDNAGIHHGDDFKRYVVFELKNIIHITHSQYSLMFRGCLTEMSCFICLAFYTKVSLHGRTQVHRIDDRCNRSLLTSVQS